MKKLILILFLMLAGFTNPVKANPANEIEQRIKGCLTRWAEWYCDSSGQWYIIIHEDDGSIKSYPVTGQGVD